ncbi:MAG TPA: 3-isopropylmalate dehydratase small subunit [Allosphingosinicella sp.]|nr:3-isopropylmalate dehydratase small subunit [Allosphingosinicella sp.]
MKGVSEVTGIAAPLLRDNVDTDAVIPSREMRSTGKSGFADGLFAGWRYTQPGGRTPDPDFVLNQPGYANAKILLAGANFGSGSSREHAVWALKEYGFGAIIAASFAPIFRNNCIRNGLVPAVLPPEAIAEIARSAEPVTVDVRQGEVALADGQSWPFPLDEEARSMLLEGLDAIDLTMRHAADIKAWQARDREARPWIYFGGQP